MTRIPLDCKRCGANIDEGQRPMTLGEVIQLLKRFEPDCRIAIYEPLRMSLDCNLSWLCPSGCGSYRGYYEHLAIHYVVKTDRVELPTATEVLAILEPAIGAIFNGWKSGEYVMNESTPVWEIALVDISKFAGPYAELIGEKPIGWTVPE